MTRFGLVTTVGVLAALGLALTLFGWRLSHESHQQVCSACSRPIHAHSLTVASVGGAERRFCCPSCAYSDHRQGHHAVRLLRLTDFENGQPLEPDRAYLVVGSRVNRCLRTEQLSDGKLQANLRYDRCAPGIQAFDSLADAEGFVAQQGGRVVRASELARMLRQ